MFVMDGVSLAMFNSIFSSNFAKTEGGALRIPVSLHVCTPLANHLSVYFNHGPCMVISTTVW